MSKWVYLSYFLNENTPTYGGGSSFSSEVMKSLASGDSCNQARLNFDIHSGTHIDFPYHFDQDGKKSSDYPADFWIFKNPLLVELNSIEKNTVITPELFTEKTPEKVPDKTDIIFIKTGFSKYRNTEAYHSQNPGLSPVLSDFIRETYPAVRAIGMDFISASPYENRKLGRETHKRFLCSERPILLIEDMNLEAISESSRLKQAIALPLLFDNADGAPINILGEIE